MSEYRDPPGEAPWAMPIVVRAEKGAEPTAAAVAEATATAVVQLLEDPRSIHGEWHEEVQRWLDGRIRKVARRARGSKWDAAARTSWSHRRASRRIGACVRPWAH